MKKEHVANITFLLLILLLLSLWVGVQVSGYKAGKQIAASRRILDIQVQETPSSEQSLSSSRVVICLDNQVHYQIIQPRADEPLLVELAHVSASPDLKPYTDANGLVRKVCLRSNTEDSVTVEVDLAQPPATISDQSVATETGASVIDIELRPAPIATASLNPAPVSVGTASLDPAPAPETAAPNSALPAIVSAASLSPLVPAATASQINLSPPRN